MTKGQCGVYADHQRRTCIQVQRTGDAVKYIELNVARGLAIDKLDAKDFDRRYKPMKNYPIEKACELYVGYSRAIGATKEALDELGKFCSITEMEYEMAISKASATEETKETKKASAKAASKTASKAAKPMSKTSVKITKVGPTDVETTGLTPEKPATKPAKVAKAKAAPKPAGEKKPSASAMFQDLIMAGKLTDDQIFETVKAEFNLDDSKKGYVKWYRNHLTKQGKNPPAAK